MFWVQRDDTLAVLQRNVKQGINDGNLRVLQRKKKKPENFAWLLI